MNIYAYTILAILIILLGFCFSITQVLKKRNNKTVIVLILGKIFQIKFMSEYKDDSSKETT